MSKKDIDDSSENNAAEVFQENESRLRSVVNSLVRDTFETQDLVQDVFVEYIQTNEVDAAIENVSAWLVTVAKNKVFDRFRKRQSQVRYEKSVVDDAAENLMAQEPDPEAMSWNTYLKEKLQEAILLLPEDQRTVFIQNELEGKSFAEISAASGVGMNTLLSRKRYAVQFLREYLQEVYDELE